MKIIKRRVCVLAASVFVFLPASALLFLWYLKQTSIVSAIVFTVVSFVAFLLIFYLVNEWKNYRAAVLIRENPIVKAELARITLSVCEGGALSQTEKWEAVVSGFGILMGTRVIPFHPGAVELKWVEIGRDYVSLFCGIDKQGWEMRMLHEAADDKRLEETAQKFRFETGVVPVIRNQPKEGNHDLSEL